MIHLISATTPSAALYNALPTLESAHDVVTKNGLIDIVVRGIGPLFLRHAVHGSWGFYLIHRHWSIKDGEFAGEDVKVWDGDNREYMLRPVDARERGYVPITYALRDGIFQPLEFSRTPEGRAAHELLMTKPDFLAQLKRLMVQTGVDRHFGLGLIRDTDEDHRWVEFTEDGESMSVSRFLKQAEAPKDHLIQTSWAFDGSVGRQCRYRCGNCYSPEVGTGGGHISGK